MVPTSGESLPTVTSARVDPTPLGATGVPDTVSRMDDRRAEIPRGSPVHAGSRTSERVGLLHRPEDLERIIDRVSTDELA